MSVSAVFILDMKGKVLIHRGYRGEFDVNVIEKFYPLLMEKEEEGSINPIIPHGHINFLFTKYNNIYRKLIVRFRKLMID